MSVVFVHGVPECAAVWDPLLAELDRDDVVALSPPGFGAPVPTGFAASSDAYAAWLVAELERLGEPVDVVGHDWGGGHALRAAIARPDLVRRLVTDVAGIGDPRYEWHELAQVWQTPGDGEALVRSMAATPAERRADALTAAGMTPESAAACAAAYDEAMGTCILALYRSAAPPKPTLWAEQYAELVERPPTLVIIPHDDAYTGGPELSRRVAQRWGAATAELEGLGHWWMQEDPAAGAEALREFLAP